MGFGPVERVRTGRGGVVVIPFGKWSSGKKNRTFSMDIAREICTDSFYTVNSGLPRVPVTAVLRHTAFLICRITQIQMQDNTDEELSSE